MSNNATVAVLGAGSWGTALAIQLARNGLQVNLWGHQADHVEALISSRENNAYLPGVKLAENIKPEASLEVCLRNVDVVLIAIPSKAFRGFLQSLKPYLESHHVLIIHHLHHIDGQQTLEFLRSVFQIVKK